MSQLAKERQSLFSDPQSVRQLREHVHHAFAVAKESLVQIKLLVDAKGKAAVEADLGPQSAELDEAYNAIKLLVVTLDPDVVVPDLE